MQCESLRDIHRKMVSNTNSYIRDFAELVYGKEHFHTLLVQSDIIY